MKILKYGTKVRDKLTGVEGYVTAFCYYYGKQDGMYLIEYKTKNDAICQEWIQAERLEKE